MDTAQPEELDRLRAEVAEWRRRAEVAEAVAAERLARAEVAERALAAAESARSGAAPVAPAAPRDVPATADPPEADGGAPAAGETAARPRSLRERWRRYIDSVN